MAMASGVALGRELLHPHALASPPPWCGVTVALRSQPTRPGLCPVRLPSFRPIPRGSPLQDPPPSGTVTKAPLVRLVLVRPNPPPPPPVSITHSQPSSSCDRSPVGRRAEGGASLTVPLPQVLHYDYYGAYGHQAHQDYTYSRLLEDDYTFDFPPHHHVVGSGVPSFPSLSPTSAGLALLASMAPAQAPCSILSPVSPFWG